ncbi:MAG: cation:proton antiporter [Flavobacteriaceae bacterium]|nr:cation:proton antiporter [Flavobacteriaceae bacterium]
MILSNIFETTLPFENPVLKFLIVLVIILAAPLLLNKIKIPHLIGLIIAGAAIGPNGFNILPRDSNIVVTGTTGLLYIMFLAGLEIDLAEFKKNSGKGLAFGMYTFLIPMGIGILASYYLLDFNLMTSVLLASMFASHTLLAYPIVSKMGVTRDLSVNVAVGGTMITDTLALIVLAVIVGMTRGEVNAEFWIRLSVSILIFGAVVLLLFPILGRWFFKTVEDKISQYIFVLVMVFFGALLAELAGIEAIIGAFLAGLSLNRLIPHTSPLMNRVEFVGNAYFIPFFLISVGMLIDFRTFISDIQTIKVAVVMTVVAIVAKYIAAMATRFTFNFNRAQGNMIFALSSAQAAATLAAVLVGFNIIISETPEGEPIRLLDESVLNGTILMILVTSTISSLVAQKSAEKLAEQATSENDEMDSGKESFLIALNHRSNTEELVGLAIHLKDHKHQHLYALNVFNESQTNEETKSANKQIQLAKDIGASADIDITEIFRHDSKFTKGISAVIREKKISDVFLGISKDKGISSNLNENIKEIISDNHEQNFYFLKSVQPLSTITKIVLVIPQKAEHHEEFLYWLQKVWKIAKHIGAKIQIFAHSSAMEFISAIQKESSVPSELHFLNDLQDFLLISRSLGIDSLLIVAMARENTLQFHRYMHRIPHLLNDYFKDSNYVLLYPKEPENPSSSLLHPILYPKDVKALDKIIKTMFK